VFGPTKVAVMLDGCFWHRCPEHATSPRRNAEWWETKFRRTIERDRETDRLLAEAGWTVLRFWEHEDPEAIADEIEREVRSRQT
jgi:DNA mismatch endonuclease (patch repair protein)